MSCVSNEFFWIIFSSTRKLLCNVFIYIMSNCFSINYSLKISVQKLILKWNSQFTRGAFNFAGCKICEMSTNSNFWNFFCIFLKFFGVHTILTKTVSNTAVIFDWKIRQSSWLWSLLKFTFRFFGQGNLKLITLKKPAVLG